MSHKDLVSSQRRGTVLAHHHFDAAASQWRAGCTLASATLTGRFTGDFARDDSKVGDWMIEKSRKDSRKVDKDQDRRPLLTTAVSNRQAPRRLEVLAIRANVAVASDDDDGDGGGGVAAAAADDDDAAADDGEGEDAAVTFRAHSSAVSVASSSVVFERREAYDTTAMTTASDAAATGGGWVLPFANGADGSGGRSFCSVGGTVGQCSSAGSAGIGGGSDDGDDDGGDDDGDDGAAVNNATTTMTSPESDASGEADAFIASTVGFMDTDVAHMTWGTCLDAQDVATPLAAGANGFDVGALAVSFEVV